MKDTIDANGKRTDSRIWDLGGDCIDVTRHSFLLYSKNGRSDIASESFVSNHLAGNQTFSHFLQALAGTEYFSLTVT